MYLIFGSVIAAVAYTLFSFVWLRKQPSGNEKMESISRAIMEGSRAYLNRQYKTAGIVALVLFLIIGFVPPLGWTAAIGFLVGASASALAGYLGMNVAVASNAKTAEAARKGLAPSLRLAFRAGSVTGFR